MKKTPRAVKKLLRGGASPIPVKPQVLMRQPKKKTTRGAFTNPAKRLAFIAESSRQGNEQAKQKQLKRAYASWYATDEGKEFTKEFGKNYSDSSPFSRGGNSDNEFHDPAELPQSRVYDNPIDKIEPEDTAPKLKNLNREDIYTISQTFWLVCRWVLDGAQNANGDSPLVAVGQRLRVAVSIMRPDIAKSQPDDKKLEFRFRDEFRHQSVLEKTGLYYGSLLEWLRRSENAPLSSRGKRVYLLFYEVWPSEIDARTLASLGSMSGITRQAMDKQANCLRDTLRGLLKAITMRADITRTRCRVAQLALG